MDFGHNKRTRSLPSSNSSGIRNLLHFNKFIRKFRFHKSIIPKYTIVPFAAISSFTLSSIINVAHASTERKFFQKNIDTYKSDTSFIDEMKNISQGFSEIGNKLNGLNEWIKTLPQTIEQFSMDLISNIFTLVGNLILKTPLWIFDNQWFNNNTYLFSMVSIGLVTVLTTIEGIKRILNKKHIDIKTIMKRWFWVAGLNTIIPFLFISTFRILNTISDKIINLNGNIINSTAQNTTTPFDLFVMVVFSLVLVGITIPTLMTNARRFFDLITLGITAPLALTAFIFDPYKHLFTQWWSNVKHLSMVQVIYAFYIMIIGLFIYGIPTPNDTMGVIFKFLLVIGGFMRLMNPPQFMSRLLDNGGSIGNEFANVKNVKNNITSKFTDTMRIIKSPMNAIKILSKGKQHKTVTGSTRMERYH